MQIIEYCKLWMRVLKRKGFIYKDHTRPQKLGDKILLLANGPSARLYDDNVEFFSDYDLLVVNFFPLKNPLFWTLKPRYLCLLDPVCINPVLCMECKAEETVKNNGLELMDAIERKVDWPLTIVSYASYSFPYKNPNISYIKLSNARIKWTDMKINKKMFFKNWAIPKAQGVIVGALYFAIIFGYQEIALLGVEQSYLNSLIVDADNRMYSAVQHFYGDSRYYISHTYEKELELVLEIFRGIRFAACMAEKENIKIINYTTDSYIQCFEKCALGSIKNTNELE